jgi:hypothetical protein
LEMNSNITSTKFVSCIDMCDRMDHQATREWRRDPNIWWT